MSDPSPRCAACGKPFSPASDWARHCPNCAGEPESVGTRVVSERGYFVDLARRGAVRKYDHYVGGQQSIAGAVCNGHRCNRPFLRLLTFDLRDPKLSFLKGANELPLLYCWVCGGEPTYRLNSDGGVRVIGRSSTGPEKDFPYPDYPPSFPKRPAVLSRVPAKLQRAIRERNAGALNPIHSSRHQIGGYPLLVQGERETNDCPECGAAMSLLATAAAESGSMKPFNEDSSAQVIFDYCAPCRIVSALHQCD